MIYSSTLAAALTTVAAASAVPVTVTVGTATSPFPHVWKRSFGSGHAGLTLRKDWQAHLELATVDLGLAGARYHGILDDDMGVVTGYRTYNFTKIDASWDYQVGLGVVPIVELSFMPAYLANCSWTPPAGPDINPVLGPVVNPNGRQNCPTTMKYKGITQQPISWDEWSHLVTALAQHAVQRYGAEAVRAWHFEVWNELWGMPFPTAYMELFNASSLALKAVDPKLQIGGPATMQLLHVTDFVKLATEGNIPFDFVSTHMYPTDPQCPQREKWGPDCLTNAVKALRKEVDPKIPLFITEYNVGCCLGYSQHDTSGAAAFIFRQMGALQGVADVLSWWTFSDVFEEGGLPRHEFQGIYGLMTYHGVPKPGWRAFQLLHSHASTTRIETTVSGAPSSPVAAERAVAKAGAGAGSDPKCYEEPKTDLTGFDILPESDKLMLPSPTACCAACRNHTAAVGDFVTETCSFWSYVAAPSRAQHGRCYLKTSDAGRTSDPAYTSGSTVAPPPPAPPAQLVSALATTAASPGAGAPVFLSFWTNGGPASNLDNRSVTVKFGGTGTGHPADAASATVSVWTIDESHANPLAAWVAMGSPAVPSPEQLKTLMAASKLGPPVQIPVATEDDGVNSATVLMAPNSAVMLLLP